MGCGVREENAAAQGHFRPYRWRQTLLKRDVAFRGGARITSVMQLGQPGASIRGGTQQARHQNALVVS